MHLWFSTLHAAGWRMPSVWGSVRCRSMRTSSSGTMSTSFIYESSSVTSFTLFIKESAQKKLSEGSQGTRAHLAAAKNCRSFMGVSTHFWMHADDFIPGRFWVQVHRGARGGQRDGDRGCQVLQGVLHRQASPLPTQPVLRLVHQVVPAKRRRREPGPPRDGEWSRLCA